MKVLRIAMFSVLACFVSMGIAGNLKIGVIDIHKLVTQSAEVKKINRDLDIRFKPRQEKIVAQQKQLQEQIAKLKRDSAVLSKAEQSKLQAQIIKDKRDLARLEQDFQQEAGTSQHEAMQNFVKKIRKSINQYAAKNNYDLILQKDLVPFASAQVDITKAILKVVG